MQINAAIISQTVISYVSLGGKKRKNSAENCVSLHYERFRAKSRIKNASFRRRSDSPRLAWRRRDCDAPDTMSAAISKQSGGTLRVGIETKEGLHA